MKRWSLCLGNVTHQILYKRCPSYVVGVVEFISTDPRRRQFRSITSYNHSGPPWCRGQGRSSESAFSILAKRMYLSRGGRREGRRDIAATYKETSSSAVAKRPRDASCLSVVSFNGTKRRVESFIVSYT